MTNEPILKNEKMNINQLITTNYINSRPIAQKKTNPFQTQNTCRGEAESEDGNPFPCRGEASCEAGSPDPPKPVPSKLKRSRMAKEGKPNFPFGQKHIAPTVDNHPLNKYYETSGRSFFMAGIA
jgi:hypothetical protein